MVQNKPRPLQREEIKNKLELAGLQKLSGPPSSAPLLEKEWNFGGINAFHRVVDLVCASHGPRAFVQNLFH